ncbi:hypothetical protein PF010_g31339 [Phytophthora fragariae]|uniref:Annexin n=1 Tax=Phytophthora fragariae TaxID=53985 RepID=A0A6G0JHP1_9STRA|nr:hypothetical protein PF010_g31339 [Phytophthora fragariae]
MSKEQYEASLVALVAAYNEVEDFSCAASSVLKPVQTYILREAAKGRGTTEEWVYPVVMARLDAETALLTTFQKEYGDGLAKVLSDEFSRDLKKVILTTMRGEVSDFKA